MIQLSDEERTRFAQYCRQEAESFEGLARQMESIKTPDVLIKRERTLAIAFSIVGERIDPENWERQSV